MTRLMIKGFMVTTAEVEGLRQIASGGHRSSRMYLGGGHDQDCPGCSLTALLDVIQERTSRELTGCRALRDLLHQVQVFIRAHKQGRLRPDLTIPQVVAALEVAALQATQEGLADLTGGGTDG